MRCHRFSHLIRVALFARTIIYPIACCWAVSTRMNQYLAYTYFFFVCLFGLMLNIPVKNYGHIGTVSSPNNPFFPWQAWVSGFKPVLCAHTFICNWQQPFLNQLKGGEWPKKLFHDQSPQKYVTGLGSNLGPLDLQSDMLSTALWAPCIYIHILQV